MGFRFSLRTVFLATLAVGLAISYGPRIVHHLETSLIMWSERQLDSGQPITGWKRPPFEWGQDLMHLRQLEYIPIPARAEDVKIVRDKDGNLMRTFTIWGRTVNQRIPRE